MGYINSAPYFCIATETVADLPNEAISQRDQSVERPLELASKYRAVDNAGTHKAKADASLENLPLDQRATAKANVDVYLDDFISVFQGGPRERRQMLGRLLHKIEIVFRPNKEADTNQKYHISRKKLGQGNGSGSTRKTVLGWDMDKIAHLLCLQPRRQDKVAAALAAIPWKAHTTSLRK